MLCRVTFLQCKDNKELSVYCWGTCQCQKCYNIVCCTKMLWWRICVAGKNKTYSYLYVNCPIFVSDFNKIWSFSKNIHEVPSIKIHSNPSNGSCVDTDRQAGRGQKDMLRLIGAFRVHANALLSSIIAQISSCKQKAILVCPFFDRDYHKILYPTPYTHSTQSNELKFPHIIRKVIKCP